MKIKNKYLFALILSSILVVLSCKKEAAIVPDNIGTDPFVRIDNPANEADHQIFLLYQQTNIPVLYSDTVCKNPFYLEDINYHIAGANSAVKVDYLNNISDILAGVDFVKNYFLPPLSDSLYPYSILLCDSLLSPVYSYLGTSYVPLNAYMGLNTFAIANVPEISKMSSDSLKRYRASIFSALLTTPLNKNNLLDNFYNVSAAYYGKYVLAGAAAGDPYYLPYLPKEEYGLISYGDESTYYYAIGTQTDDLAQYLNKVLSLTAEQFQQQFQEYPLVMSKYQYLITALQQIGFKIDSL